jgi:hypothetical protein
LAAIAVVDRYGVYVMEVFQLTGNSAGAIIWDSNYGGAVSPILQMLSLKTESFGSLFP